MPSFFVKRKKFQKGTLATYFEGESLRKKKNVAKTKTPVRKSKKISKDYVPKDNPIDKFTQENVSKINEEIHEYDNVEE